MFLTIIENNTRVQLNCNIRIRLNGTIFVLIITDTNCKTAIVREYNLLWDKPFNYFFLRKAWEMLTYSAFDYA